TAFSVFAPFATTWTLVSMSWSKVSTSGLRGGTFTAWLVGDTEIIFGGGGGGGGAAAVLNPPETVSRSTLLVPENWVNTVLAPLVGGLIVQVTFVRCGQPGKHLSVSVRLSAPQVPVTLRLVGVISKLPTHKPGF